MNVFTIVDFLNINLHKIAMFAENKTAKSWIYMFIIPFVIFSNFFDIFTVLLGAMYGEDKQPTKPTEDKHQFVVDMQIDLTKEAPELTLNKNKVKFIYNISIHKHVFSHINVTIIQGC